MRLFPSCLRLLASLLLFALVPACVPSDDDDDSTPEPACDNDTAPEVQVQAIEDGQPVDFEVQVIAQVSDPDGVSTVSLYYRTEGAAGFSFTFMSNEGTGSEDIYVGNIPASIVQDPGVNFYVRATDRVVPCTGESFSPAAAPDEWYSFTTRLDVELLPFYSNFEFDGSACIDSNIESLGWTVAFESFPQSIHNWRTDDRNPLSGSCSASHSEGIPGGFWECPPPDGEGTIVRKNWLISPPLDFSGKDLIAVRWFERHLDSGICAEAHQLYVSTTFPDPDLGEYTLIADLPLSGSAWESSAWHDLSAYAGNEKVYVALYYEGGSAGRWQVDDFYVGEPLADIALDSASELPQGTGPGSSAVELTVSVVNVSAAYGAAELSATLTSSDPELTVGLPTGLTAATGMDALAHNLEAFCAPGYHPMARGIAVEGIGLVKRWLPTAVEDGTDLEARGNMLVASMMGATAFQRGLGAMHALAHPLGALYDAHHGLLNAVLMPYVLQANWHAIESELDYLSRALALDGAESILAWILELRARIGIPGNLGALNIDDAQADKVATMATEDPSAASNPIPLSQVQYRTVFTRAVKGEL